MNTKTIMSTSAIFMGFIGAVLSFLPNEIADYLSVEPNNITILFLKILSALYLGFGMLNWMAKGTLIGGIYNKPIAIGNLMHFGVGSIALFKVVSSIQTHPEIIISLTVVYVVFTVIFAYIFSANPIKTEKRT